MASLARPSSLASLFPRASSGPTGANVAAVDPPLIPINLPTLIEWHIERRQDAIPRAVLTPPTMPVIDRTPPPAALGNVAPLHTCVELPEDTI
jgi:hypothetical protein